MDEAVEQLKKMSTSTVGDTLDRLGIAGHCFGILPLDPSFRLCGRAFTMRTLPAHACGATVGDYIDDVPPERVITIDNVGRLDATIWGRHHDPGCGEARYRGLGPGRCLPQRQPKPRSRISRLQPGPIDADGKESGGT